MSGSVVLKPSGQEHVELGHPVGNRAVLDLIDLIDGSPQLTKWRPIEFEMVKKDGSRKLRAVDAPWYGDDILIFKPAVLHAMGDYLQHYGEFLPVICKDTEIVLYNPTRVIDALDEKKSQIVRFDSGRIMAIEKYVFHADRIASVDVFKLPMRASATYVSPRFADIWASHGLTGLDFVPVK